MKTAPIEINRVCTLKKGDKFLYDGTWKEVIFINANSIKFKTVFGAARIKRLGKKSMLFVQIDRKPATSQK
jgi:hypothetical protein